MLLISKLCYAFALLLAADVCLAQSVKDFVRIQSPEVAFEHVRVIDGTGAAARFDQTIVISGGKIAATGNSRTIRIPSNAKRFDFSGYSALPGLVGMHDHLFYSVNFFGDDGVRAYDMPFGGDIAGFGDQREVELLVEAGFAPVEAIKIASLNGATFLKQSERIGSLAAGKAADIVLVKGDPSTSIRDIENVEVVFKDGVGYDSKKLIDSVACLVGVR
jgi:imidazolonepropionase-like amidohydrolase